MIFEDLALSVGAALWLGVLTSISPCPLATNVAAVAFIGKQVGHPGRVFFAGCLYTLGRSLCYLLIGSLLVSSLLTAPILSGFLQNFMNRLIGPILILVGMFLLNLIQLGFIGFGIGQNAQNRMETMGLFGAGLMGFLFALSFCPVSAALFFGSLIPLSVQYDSVFWVPLSYGIGTGLPVLIFAVLIAAGISTLGRIFDLISRFEVWGRLVTGWVFVIIGIYLCLKNIFGIL